MKFVVAAIFVSFVSLSHLAHAKVVNGRCGDHWFSVRFSLDTDTQKGEIYLAGDSGAEGRFSVNLVQEEGPDGFKLVANSTKLRPYLKVVWATVSEGFYSEDGSKSSELGLGPCRIFSHNE